MKLAFIIASSIFLLGIQVCAEEQNNNSTESPSTESPSPRDSVDGRDGSKIPWSICGTYRNVSGIVHRNGRVIGGRDAFIEEFPWQVSLQKFRIAFPLPIPDWGHTCGASIINDYWLLTAAHCVDG